MPREEKGHAMKLTPADLNAIEQRAKALYRITHPGSCEKQRSAACEDLLLVLAELARVRTALERYITLSGVRFHE